MDTLDNEFLKPYAGKYIWWQSPEVSLAMPRRVIAQVMNIGDFDDMQTLAAKVGDVVLRDVLTHAEAGQFNARSWHYWHYRLGIATVDHVPELPRRKFA